MCVRLIYADRFENLIENHVLFMGRLLSAKLIVRKIEWCFCAVSLFGNSTHSSIVNSKITFNNNIYTADWANECCDNNNCDYYCLVSPLCLLKQSNFQASFFMQTFFLWCFSFERNSNCTITRMSDTNGKRNIAYSLHCQPKWMECTFVQQCR